MRKKQTNKIYGDSSIFVEPHHIHLAEITNMIMKQAVCQNLNKNMAQSKPVFVQ